MMIAVKANLVVRQCFDHVHPAMVFQRSGVVACQVEVANQSFIGKELGDRFDVVKIFRLICHFSREREDNLRARLTFRGWIRDLICSQIRGLEFVEHR